CPQATKMEAANTSEINFILFLLKRQSYRVCSGASAVKLLTAKSFRSDQKLATSGADGNQRAAVSCQPGYKLWIGQSQVNLPIEGGKESVEHAGQFLFANLSFVEKSFSCGIKLYSFFPDLANH